MEITIHAMTTSITESQIVSTQKKDMLGERKIKQK